MLMLTENNHLETRKPVFVDPKLLFKFNPKTPAPLSTLFT